MDQVDQICARFGLDQYGEVPIIKKLSELTKQKHQHVVLGLLVILLISCFSRPGQWLLSSIFTFLIPAYYSFKALQKDGAVDDKKWLTYWVVFGFNHCFEDLIFKVLFFVPLIRIIRTGLMVYLYVSKEQGSEWFFQTVVSPAFRSIGPSVDPIVSKFEDVAQLQKFKAD